MSVIRLRDGGLPIGRFICSRRITTTPRLHTGANSSEPPTRTNLKTARTSWPPWASPGRAHTTFGPHTGFSQFTTWPSTVSAVAEHMHALPNQHMLSIVPPGRRGGCRCYHFRSIFKYMQFDTKFNFKYIHNHHSKLLNLVFKKQRKRADLAARPTGLEHRPWPKPNLPISQNVQN